LKNLGGVGVADPSQGIVHDSPKSNMRLSRHFLWLMEGNGLHLSSTSQVPCITHGKKEGQLNSHLPNLPLYDFPVLQAAIVIRQGFPAFSKGNKTKSIQKSLALQSHPIHKELIPLQVHWRLLRQEVGSAGIAPCGLFNSI